MEDAIEQTPRGLALRVCLNLRNGLHARPAARLAQEAQRYAASIQLISDTGEVDAKSMLDILSLAPPGPSSSRWTSSAPCFAAWTTPTCATAPRTSALWGCACATG